MKAGPAFPVRARFAKRGPVRFISHRDVARAFDRALRTARLPIAFTGGFSPRPRLSFGLALPVGAESDAEFVDLAFDEVVDLEHVTTSLTAGLPEGIPVTGAGALVERAPALQDSVAAVDYVVDVADGSGRPVTDDALAEAIDAFTARGEVRVARTRKGRERVDDIRPAVRSLTRAVGTAPRSQVDLRVSTAPPAARPAEIVPVLGDGWQPSRIRRTQQWIERDGALADPLEADTRPRAQEARAS